MKKIYAISGSASMNSSNKRMLRSIKRHFNDYTIEIDQNLLNLPLYTPDKDCSPFSDEVLVWRESILQSYAVIICTPEYLHNIPAALKNGLEWLKTHGELYGKKVLPITFTPHPPRGEHAMSSLIHSLQALQAQIVVEMSFYQQEMIMQEDHYRFTPEQIEMWKMGLELLL